MGTTRLRSDQYADFDIDFVGRISRQPREIPVTWDFSDPNGVGRFEIGVGGDPDDQSKGRFTPNPGRSGIATMSWSAEEGGQRFQGSETFEVEGEGLDFVGQTVTVGDQATPQP